MKKEHWKTYPNDLRYEVSNLGKVRMIGSGKVRKPVVLKNGYASLAFATPRKLRYVHRMVLETFRPTERINVEVSHRDGNRLNNVLSNLEWETRLENNRRKVGHHTDNGGERNPMARLTLAKVNEIRAKDWSGVSYAKVAELYGVGRETVRKVIKREAWT
jgi:hypothetical protein